MICFPYISGCVFHYSAHFLSFCCISCCYLSHLVHISDWQCWNSRFALCFTRPTRLHSYFHDLFLCCSLLLFAAAMWHFPPTQIMKDWSHHRETEGGKEKQRENWIAGSIQGTELQYLWLCVLLLSSVVVLIGARLSSTQQSDPLNLTPKTTDTQPPTHRETKARSDRHGQDGREVEKDRERDGA